MECRRSSRCPLTCYKYTRDQLLAHVKAQKLNRARVISYSLGGFLAFWMTTAAPPPPQYSPRSTLCQPSRPKTGFLCRTASAAGLCD